MTKNNRYIASIILGLVAIGFLLCYPFRDSFAGGLLTALFSASMIGGFADWFGITALFRKPLGIPFKTEIIPKGRDRIFGHLSDMVEKELLSKDALIKKLDRFSISRKLIYYMENQDGKKECTLLVNRIASDVLGRIDPSLAASWLEKIINESSDSVKLSPLINDALEWVSKTSPDEKIITEAADKVTDLLVFPAVRSLVENTAEEFMSRIGENADRESTGRRLFFKFVLTLADFSDASPSRISSRIVLEGLEYVKKLKDPESSQRKGLEMWIGNTVDDFRTNIELQNKIEKKKAETINRAVTSPYFAKKVSGFLNGSDKYLRLEGYIESLVDKITADFADSPSKQAELDAYVKNMLSRLIDEKHSEIGKLVRHKLDQFSNEMLVDMIEDKAGNDLQIIRINGSVVGGLTGMFIYLLTFWL